MKLKTAMMIWMKWITSTCQEEVNPQVNELQVLYNATLILKQKIDEIPKFGLPWPPLASDLTMDNARKVVPCELFNTLAWICGFSSDLVVDNFVNVNSKENAKLMSITQDLLAWHPNKEIVLPRAQHLLWRFAN